MKGQIADKLNTEERCELKDEDFGIPETREFPMPDAPVSYTHLTLPTNREV